ncbi:MAG: glycosyltransferase family 2 protein [Anaerolineales bacterium]|nr:glycosyltransferase family 2 protein [Anaerolineales bacterium]
MLTNSLALSAIWLILSSIVTFLLGTRVRQGNKLNGVLWLLTVILFGDLWAVFTFGELNQVLILSLVAIVCGVVWILLLPNWNWFGQTTWTMSSYTFEMLDVCTRFRWNHVAGPAQPVSGYTPKVSLQVPAYNEPLEVVEATLRTLAKINYPNFEVLLIDNNTPDEATWRPLESLQRTWPKL